MTVLEISVQASLAHLAIINSGQFRTKKISLAGSVLERFRLSIYITARGEEV